MTEYVLGRWIGGKEESVEVVEMEVKELRQGGGRWRGREWEKPNFWFDFHLVGLYANMAEMPGVRQIDGSYPFFCRNWKLILNYKTSVW